MSSAQQRLLLGRHAWLCLTDKYCLLSLARPRYFYWEGVDMVRKLTLVGLLVVVGRGTVAQLFVAVCISCVSLLLQVHLAPYKHWSVLIHAFFPPFDN